MKKIAMIIAWTCLATLAQAQAPNLKQNIDEWTLVKRAEMDTNNLAGRVQDALACGIQWQEAQTPHFVVHFENGIFARKVGRLGEFFYSYIAQDLQGVQDRVEGRSHIFIFRNPKQWKEWLSKSSGVASWSFSYVSGTTMFLQQAEDAAFSKEVLAHEMTHLVVNRFFPGKPPLWLNEGMAEYYEEFAYSAFKGIKKSKRPQFQRLKRSIPLQELFGMTAYPEDEALVHVFYQTSKFFVGFLLLDNPPDRFAAFAKELAETNIDALAAIQQTYGFADLATLQKAFDKFKN